MPLTTVHSPPALDSFTSLTDHQSQTPTNFFGAKPVLHYHAVEVQAFTSPDEASRIAIFGARNASLINGATNTQPPGPGPEGPASVVELVDIFVSSENLILFNNVTSTGVSIPYPVISIHAIQRLLSPSDPSKEVQGLYMQLEFEYEPAKDDEEPETTELILLLPDSASSDTLAGPIQILFEAVSSCSNLHPDPIFQDEDMEDMDNGIMFEGIGHEGIDGLPGVLRGSNDGGLPPPFSGSSGWITAENVGEYFDEDGNWIGDVGDGKLDSLEGAGRVRARDEAALLGTNDHGRIEENKRLRVE